MFQFAAYNPHAGPPTSGLTDTSNDATESMAQDAPTDKQPTQFLATIVSQFIEQGMQDEELETPPLLTPVTNHPLIRLDALFYFP